MATAAGHRRRFFLSGRMAPEIDDACMATDAAKIAVSGLRELSAKRVSVMAILTLTHGNGRLGDSGDRFKRDPCSAEKAEKRDNCRLFHVV